MIVSAKFVQRFQVVALSKINQIQLVIPVALSVAMSTRSTPYIRDYSFQFINLKATNVSNSHRQPCLILTR